MTFLICGLGSIGKRHLRILKKTGDHKFIALRSGGSGSGKAENIDVEITDIKNITDHKIDGALITNPTSLHISTAIELAKQKIPLFIEKPLGKNLDGADELLKIVEHAGIPVLIGYNFIYHPAIIKIKELIAENKIGKVISARAQFGTFMPHWHKDEEYKNSYAANASMGGGVVLTSIHEQNYLTDMFGEIVNIKAMETGGDNIGIDAEEGAEILLKHKSGVVSNIHLNFYQKPYFRNLQIIGSEGTILWDFMKPEIKILFKDNTEVLKLGDDPMELLDKSYEGQMTHFIQVASGKEQSRIPLSKGIDDMKVALQILKEIGRN
ncbi:MAG: Gfo/Idh/MocA family oxidoreductase [Ignavibacteria bacterium]